MISDILFQAVVDLDHYLNDPNFDGTYKGELRKRIIQLRDEADYKTEKGMTMTDETYKCAWQGCKATGSGWGWAGPKAPGWLFATNIPPDDIDGPLCPEHGPALEDWRQYEFQDGEPSQ